LGRSSRVLRAYAQGIVALRWVVLIAAIGLTAFWASRVGTLQLDTNPQAWAPQNHPYVTTTNLLEEVFGGKNIVIVRIVPKQGDIYPPQVLAKIQRLQKRIEQMPHAVRRAAKLRMLCA
jgi:predicted RND superfamily exporter protein